MQNLDHYRYFCQLYEAFTDQPNNDLPPNIYPILLRILALEARRTGPRVMGKRTKRLFY